MRVFINDSLIHILPFAEKKEKALKINSAKELMPYFLDLQDNPQAPQTLFFRAKPYKLICYELVEHFSLIEAAGGIVCQKDQVLWIKRNGKWDLPKGKIEKNESKKKTAVREVEEECGIRAKLKNKIGKTWHTYRMGEEFVLKCTHWYEMEGAENQILIAQTEEGITEVAWFSIAESEKIAKESYASIQLIFEKFLKEK